MSIKTELLAIQQADPGHVLHVSDVKEWARENTHSALFRSIEWDNDIAAERHRDWQIRQLIQIHVISEDRTPMLVNLSIDRVAGGGYRSVSDVIGVKDLREIMLADALAELQRVQLKYQRVTELSSVWIEAERVRTQPRVRQRRGARDTVSA